VYETTKKGGEEGLGTTKKTKCSNENKIIKKKKNKVAIIIIS